jgi:uncharacterized protein YhbP (UPF0306 family)
MIDKQKQLAKIESLLREQSTLALATVNEQGLASVAPLYYLVDEDLTLYWVSSGSSEHSRNLLRDSRVAGTVYVETERWKEIRGVQMRGIATVVMEPARRKLILEKYCNRFHLGRVFRLVIRQSTLYAFRPEFFRFIDNTTGFASGFEVTREASDEREGALGAI